MAESNKNYGGYIGKRSVNGKQERAKGKGTEKEENGRENGGMGDEKWKG